MSETPRLIFAGTPDFAVPALRMLIESGYNVVAAYTQPDRPAGRGRQLRPSPVKVYATAARIPVCQPVSLRDAAVQSALAEWQADLFIVAAYGLILPPAVLALPRLGSLNIHASLLPRWRGAAPIQRALLAGDRETGISLMSMEEGLDTGAIFTSTAIPIERGMSGGALHDALAMLGATTLHTALPAILAQRLSAEPQDAALATYAAKLTKSEVNLDWSRPALELERQVLAFNPYPIAQTVLDGQTLRIWRALAEPFSSNQPVGTVFEEGAAGLLVATGSGSLRVTEVQLPGGKPLAIAAFRNARRLLGQRLGMA